MVVGGNTRILVERLPTRRYGKRESKLESTRFRLGLILIGEAFFSDKANVIIKLMRINYDRPVASPRDDPSILLI